MSIERLEERAKTLAARFTVDPNDRGQSRSVFPRFEENARILREGYGILADDVHEGEHVTPAAEWLLDNFHLVASVIRDVQQNLPRSYYRELPKLASPGLGGDARVYAMAVELIRHSDSRLDRQKLLRFINSYQTIAPLTIGELWAWPIMLKLALIENLRRLAVETLVAREARRKAGALVARIGEAGEGKTPSLPAVLHPAFVLELLQRVREYGPRLSAVRSAVIEHLAAQQLSPEDAIRLEHQRLASAQVSVANAVTSLRLSTALDWSEYFEAVSLVEQVLERDPAGVYGSMDFLSRDRYRQAVERLAERTGEAQLRVALRAVESARLAAEESSTSDRAAHLGYHLIGKGRRDLEKDVAHRPGLVRRAHQLVFSRATAVYLGAIGLGTSLLCGLGLAYARAEGASTWAQAGVVLALFLPASELVIALVQRVAARLVPPRRLVRLDFASGLPESARTMVVVPTLLTRISDVAERIEHLEVLALGNLDPRIHFAILSDFADAPARQMPDDEAILSAARAGVEGLNARFADGGSNKFYLFHRERQWNPGESAWMGWERKRGKIDELNRLLRGATDTSFKVHVGDVMALPSIRYCITLDSDTRLPRDAAKKLVGIIAHPLNRPTFDSRYGRVTDGYGILQPRVSVTMASASGSLFARLYAGHTGVDPYTTAVSDTYQDLFGEGIFTGKGLYDVDAFVASLDGRVPENALLSHDLFEGLYARTALVTDVEVVDDYPSSVLAHTRRQHRWVRGDWQILWWLLPYVPTPSGLTRNRLPLISRFKIFDNLRRSLLASATLVLLLLAWTILPGSPVVWTAATLAAVAFPLYPIVLEAVAGPKPQQPWRAFQRAVWDDVKTAMARASLQLTFVANQAFEDAHAIVLTLVRLGLTRQGLLEWETAAAGATRSSGPRAFLVRMMASPAIALSGVVLIAVVRPVALLAAVPVLALWTAAPLIAYALSRPASAQHIELEDEDRKLLLSIAQHSWRYFEEFMGAENHGLPPDNLQERPDPRLAHRTSPTNIGMGLMATLAARDLGLIATKVMVERLERTLSTMEGLERFEGHFLNWYDTRSLAPLFPRYVSTVDSGNLAGALVTVAEGLIELARSSPESTLGPRIDTLAVRAAGFAEEMKFRSLYDAERGMLSIGYKLADAEGPGRLDPSYYDLLASEARLASFIAIAKGDLPEAHWFRLGRLLTSVDGNPTLLSWSATLFEYLMPLLIMRSYPGTLLHKSCEMAVRSQRSYAAANQVPWGISESAYGLVDRHDNYQYKAFGVPGLGLKRGLGDELVVAPYATALAAMIDPVAASRNFRRLEAEGLFGKYGFYESIDYAHPKSEQLKLPVNGMQGTVVRAFFAHHQGMTLVSLANVLLADVMVKRFHANPRVQATELLLQERVPRHTALTRPRPAEETRVAAAVPAAAVRRYRTPHTPVPHAQFLSNGNYTTVVTNAGGGASFCRGLAVTRYRQDPTLDPGSQYLYLRDIRSGSVWSATHQPLGKEPQEYLVTFLPEKATFHRRDDDIVTQLDIAVSTEDDVEVRRLAVTNKSDRPREIEVTSYAEIVLARLDDDLAHPAFGKLFIETEYLSDGGALLCRRRPRSPGEAELFAVHALSLEGRNQGPVEWESDRKQFHGRGRGPGHPQSLDGRPLSGTTGALLDPIVSLRQRVRLGPGGFVRLSFATGMASTRETALALAEKYRDPGATARTFALAFAHAQSGLHHLGISSEEARLFERLASRVLYADGSLRASPDLLVQNELGQEGLWPHSISGDLPILLVRVVEENSVPLVRQVLRAQEYWRLKGLSADVVILNEHPTSYLDEMQGHLAALLDNGSWREWKHRPGGAYLLRGDGMTEGERILLASVARAVLSGERGTLAQQLDGLPLEQPEPEELVPSRTGWTSSSPGPTMPHWDLFNGIGGFSEEGREYAIVLEGDQETPSPWVNVIANPIFGTLVTASGAAHTWSANSRENRLTPFATDPVTDP
ncbi:MAG TPA: glucoamylase family protein, partial [Vicinamibacteria bacterium]|nr:glucoamylase family protein [Vicinamibacteria bacterium]